LATALIAGGGEIDTEEASGGSTDSSSGEIRIGLLTFGRGMGRKAGAVAGVVIT
jgi:hypothetical protein